MFSRLLVANRGEIAARVMRSARRLGVSPVCVYSQADRGAAWLDGADAALEIGPGEARLSYLDAARVIDAAKRLGADALHPGYGFLSENASFAQAVQAAGLVWVGPHPEAMRRMGSKAAARQLARELDIPVLPGYDGDDASDAALYAAAERIGFPILIKASAGGGGRGMRVVRAPGDLAGALRDARREAESAFGDGRLILERWIASPRHVEVQVMGDRSGGLVHLFERECSVQRRHQKLVEEAPAPGLDARAREALYAHALRLAGAIGYDSAGTVEFLLDGETGEAFFLEMNTRLQVEHPTTELVTGLDLVELQLRAAAGERIGLEQSDVRLDGWSVEVRLCAEDPARDHAPQTGTIEWLEWPALPGVRVDAGVRTGSRVPPYYDSLLAKLIAWGPDRGSAIGQLAGALDATWLAGVATNVDLLRAVLAHPRFRAGRLSTDFLAQLGALPDGAPEPRLPHAALAALALRLGRRARLGADAPEWRRLGAWRLLEPAGHPARAQLALEEQSGERAEVVLRGDSEVDAGHGAAVLRAHLDGNALRIEGGHGALAVPVRFAGERVCVRAGGRTSVWRELAREVVLEAARERATGSARTLRAPFPGVVRELRVVPGQRVREGEVLVVIEAMKMMHNLAASGSGTVAEVRCREGDTLDGGQVLVVFAEERPHEPAE
jgi:3-methylcrotonyl-CoA carboxylase alpha subunit